MVPVVAKNEMRNPPLAFAVSEGVVVVVIQETPPLTFGAREGLVVVVVTQNKQETPPLMFGAREGVVVGSCPE